MTCREFAKKVEELTPVELGRSTDYELLAHGRECPHCVEWFQQQQSLSGAMQALGSSTAAMEAPSHVEYAVMRVFRQSIPAASPDLEGTVRQPFALRLSRFFEWGAYAAVAAALAVTIGLGLWFWQHSGRTPAQSAQHEIIVPQPVAAQPEVLQTPKVPPVAERPVQAARVDESHTAKQQETVAEKQPTAASPSPTQLAQAQGYTPLMLCDPLSCSGDEQVVRMQLPASAAYGSSSSQPVMADVIVGDDGLVRAIRIVQQ